MCRNLPYLSASALIALLALGAGAQDEKKPAAPAPAAGAQDEKKAGAPAPAGQDEKKPAAAAPDQDKTAISQSLEAWYKVTSRGEQGEEHIGYMHAAIRADNQVRWRWTFDMTGETDLVLPDPKEPGKRVPVTFSSRLTANLDDAFMPVQAEEIALLGSAEVKTVVSSDEQGRRLDVAVGGERRSFSLRSEEEVHYGLFLMFLSLRQNGALARPGARKAFLAHVDPQGGTPFVEVTFQIREMVKKEYLGRKDVSVTPVTFLKPPPALQRDYELTEVFLDRYGRIVEASTRGGHRYLLVKTEKDAVGNRPLIGAARRDPFDKEQAMRPTGPQQPGPDKDKIAPPNSADQVNINLTQVGKLVDELDKAQKEKNEVEAERVYQTILEHLDAIQQANASKTITLTPQQIGEMDKHRDRAEKIYGGEERLMKQLQLVYVKAMQMFDEDDCPGLEKAIETLKSGQLRKELRNRPGQSKVSQWVGHLEPLVTRCKTRLELARKKLVLTGTTLKDEWQQVPVDVRVSAFGHQIGTLPTVRFVKPIRMAVINGQSFRVGDLVTGEGVRIERIWAYGVQVSLRDETRDIGIQQ